MSNRRLDVKQLHNVTTSKITPPMFSKRKEFKETMTNEIQNTSTPVAIKIDDAKLKGARVNRYGSQELVYAIADPWNPSAPAIEQEVRLYTSPFGSQEPDDQIIAQTQENLRTALNSDEITFHAQPDPNDPNDIINWAKSHPDVNVNIYTVNGKVRLTDKVATGNGSGAFGGSQFLKKYNPSKQEPFDPDKFLVGFLDAQTEEDQHTINQLDLTNGSLSESTYNGKKRVTFFGNGTIDRTIFTGTAPFVNGAHAETEDATVIQLIDKLLPVLVTDADKDVADKLTALKSNPSAGLYNVYEIIGGYYANNVSETFQTAIKSILNTVSGVIATFYVRTQAGKLFQVSTGPMRSNGKLHIEFLAADFKPIDVTRPLLQSGLVDRMEMTQIAAELGFFTKEKGLVLNNPGEALTFLNAIFQGRSVRYFSAVMSNGQKSDTQRLGSRIYSVGESQAPTPRDVTNSSTVAIETKTVQPEPQSEPQPVVEEPVEETAPQDTPKENIVDPFGASASDNSKDETSSELPPNPFDV